jgi:hypothetical protein
MCMDLFQLCGPPATRLGYWELLGRPGVGVVATGFNCVAHPPVEPAIQNADLAVRIRPHAALEDRGATFKPPLKSCMRFRLLAIIQDQADSRVSFKPLATLAIPRACATCRKARRSTRGSSASSRAALRYSAADSGSLRVREIIASSCEALALRIISSLLLT